MGCRSGPPTRALPVGRLGGRYLITQKLCTLPLASNRDEHSAHLRLLKESRSSCKGRLLGLCLGDDSLRSHEAGSLIGSIRSLVCSAPLAMGDTTTRSYVGGPHLDSAVHILADLRLSRVEGIVRFLLALVIAFTFILSFSFAFVVGGRGASLTLPFAFTFAPFGRSR